MIDLEKAIAEWHKANIQDKSVKDKTVYNF